MLEHSPLGASSAERWLNCPGSVQLIDMLRDIPFEAGKADPSYQTEGVLAHELAAECLTKDMDAWELDCSQDMMDAIQTYLDYVRSKKGWQFTELRMHRPEFHELMYGTTDACVLDPDRLEVIDYKHGVGIVVEVEENPQIMYYAFMVIDELGSAWNDDCGITLTICQPRVGWRDPIRSWSTTVGTIRAWARETLKPAMDRIYQDAFLSAGDHCRFCPAKLLCPAFLSTANRARKLDLEQLETLSAPVLASLLSDVSVLAMAIKALRGEARRRMIHNNGELPGWKVVKAKGDRVLKEDAPVEDTFGEEAWQPAKLKSPAQIEKMGDTGKKFVAEWAFSPDLGYDIVPESDRRIAVKIETSAEKWKKLLDNLKPQD